jgi:hypothetical protein
LLMTLADTIKYCGFEIRYRIRLGMASSWM